MDFSSIANNINYRYQPSSRLQIGGAISGLDTASIIEKLLEVESYPLKRLDEKYRNLDKVQKAYRSVSEKIREFYNYISNFSLQSTLIPKTASLSDLSVLSVKPTPSASDGVYSITVNSLATNSSYHGTYFGKQIQSTTQYSEINARYNPVDNSTVKIKIGTNEQTFTVNASDTVDDIVTKIQDAFSAAGASASVTFDESTGILKIQSSSAFQISNVSGNFTIVFRLNDSVITKVGNDYVLQSSGNIGAYGTLKTMADLGIVSDTTIQINSKAIDIKTTDTISQVISKINNVDQNIQAKYDDKTGTIKIVDKRTGDYVIDVSGPAELGLSAGTFTLGDVASVTVTSAFGSETVQSKNNTLTYQGLELTLLKTGTSTVTVGTDKEQIVNRLKDFVSKWNEMIDFVYGKLTEDKVKGKSEDEMSEEEKIKGYLKNDSYLRRIFDRMRNFVYTQVDGVSLNQFGISFGDTGKDYSNTMKGRLSLDEDKLRTFLNENSPEKVWEFFGKVEASTKGWAIQVKEFTYNLTKFNGEIDTVAGVSGRIEREKRILSKRMVSMLEMLEKKEKYLWDKYTRLESVLAKLNAQGSYITQATQARK